MAVLPFDDVIAGNSYMEKSTIPQAVDPIDGRYNPAKEFTAAN